MANEKKDYAQIMAEKVIAALENGTAPWVKPWQPGEIPNPPMNPTTGNAYKGWNRVWLATAQPDNDPRWMTYNQAKAIGAQVREGEKSTPIFIWKTHTQKLITDDKGKPILNEEGKKQYRTVAYERPYHNTAFVFHASQIDGLPELPPQEPIAEFQRHEDAEKILAASLSSIIHGGNSAHYSPASDKIHMPSRGQFDSPDAYYATALHEFGHSTGHFSRLDRDLTGGFGSENYAKEELRAEMFSLMLGQEIGIGHDPEQHHAYIGSWIKALKEDPEELFRAASDAQLIMDYTHERVKEYEQEQQSEAQYQEQRESREALAQENAVSELEQWVIREIIRRVDAMKPEPEAEFTIFEVETTPTGIEEALQAHPGNGTEAFEEDARAISHQTIRKALIGTAEMVSLPDTPSPEARRVAMANVQRIREEMRETTNPAEAQQGEQENRTQQALSINVPAVTGTNGTEYFVYRDALCYAIPEKNYTYPVNLSNYEYYLQGQIKEAEQAKEQVAIQSRADDLPSTAKPQGANQEQPDTLPKQENTSSFVVPHQPTLATEKTFLAIPFADKDKAKKAAGQLPEGGQAIGWDRNAKSWYANPGANLDKLTQWLPQHRARGSEQDRPMSPEQEFANTLKDAGFVVEGNPVMDGSTQRCTVEGDTNGQKSGKYVAHLDGCPAGWYRNFRADDDHKKWAYTGNKVDRDSREEFDRKNAENAARRKAEQAIKWENRAEECTRKWHSLVPCPSDNRYLTSKGLDVDDPARTFGVKQDERGNLVVPVRDKDGKLWAVTAYGMDGFKQFERDVKVDGCFHVIGGRAALKDDESQPVIIATGFSTAASIHLATGQPVVVAFSDRNLKAVAEEFRHIFPQRPLLICGDDDRHLVANDKPNSGRESANATATAVRGKAVFPRFSNNAPADKAHSDFNDIARAYGMDALKRQVMQALSQARGTVDNHRDLEKAEKKDKQGEKKAEGAGMGR